MKKGGSKGFTLVEILVVVAILGFLAALTVATVSSAREKARLAAAKSFAAALHRAHSAGMLAYWKLDEAGSNGTVISDFSGFANHGTVSGTLIQHSATACMVGTCLEFDGGSNYITAPESIASTPATGVVLSVWVYPTADGGNNGARIVAKGTSGTDDYALVFRNNSGSEENIVRFHIGGASALMSPEFILRLNAWNHVASVYNGQTMKIYVDGKEVATQNYSTAITDNSNTIYIGRNADAADATKRFRGRIDEVYIYNGG